MLILTRRVGEKLIIRDDIEVTILGYRGNQIRIGIQAPLEVEVYREEIYNKIKNINSKSTYYEYDEDI